MKDVVYEEAWD